MIRFHIPDFQKNFRLNVLFCRYFEVYRNYFFGDVEIEYIYDSFPVAWNGGRLVKGEIDLSVAEQTLRKIAGMQKKVSFTFTNSLITEEHLQNEAANAVMKIASDLDMEKSVIIHSSLLEQYIRDRYPDFGIILSTTKMLKTAPDVNAALERDYELVVLDYNMNHAWDALLEIKDRKRCEFLVDACCVDECPKRQAHYQMISRLQMMNEDPALREGIHDSGCIYGKNNYFAAKKNANFMTIEEIQTKYAPAGFEHMKLEGRGGDRLNLLEQYVHYMARPEFRDQVRFEMLQLLG